MIYKINGYATFFKITNYFCSATKDQINFCFIFIKFPYYSCELDQSLLCQSKIIENDINIKLNIMYIKNYDIQSPQ